MHFPSMRASYRGALYASGGLGVVDFTLPSVFDVIVNNYERFRVLWSLDLTASEDL